MLSALKRLAERLRLPELDQGFRENRLLTYASAISFRVLFAIVPFTLFVLAVLGFLHLDGVWAREVAPEVRASVSKAMYQVIDQAVRNVLAGRQLFWLTGGGAIALWGMSGAVRATMEALDGIYDVREERSLAQRLRRSLWLAAAIGGCFLGALAAVRLGPLAMHQGGHDVVLGVVSFLVRWGVAISLLTLAVFLTVRYGVACPQPARWVSLGSGLAVSSWIVMSLGFAAYVTGIASYGSVYGSLASVIVAFSYIYMSCVAFLFGVQVDALVRDEAEGDPTGQQERGRHEDKQEQHPATQAS